MKIFNLLGTGFNTTGINDTINSIKNTLSAIVLGAIAILAICAVVYAIYIAFKLGKAEDDGKRKEAKSHLMWAIIGLVAAVVVVGLVEFVFQVGAIQTDDVGDSDVANMVDETVSLVVSIVGLILSFGTLAGLAFGAYIAYKLITASDDGKRKQAKQQLIWTLVAVLAVYVLSAVIQGVYNALSAKLVPIAISDLLSGFGL